MRFNEFKIIKEASENIAVIGDSIAVGIKGAGGASAGNAVGGSNTKQVLGFVTDFVQSGKAKGATVILSSGAANSANVSTEDGKKFQSENLGPVSAQIKQLKDAGAKVLLVGVASGKTPPQKPTQYTNGKKWVIDYTGMNDQLAAIASANGATFLGPLEEFDPGISKGDGIHPYNGYGKLFKAGSAGAGTNLGPAGATPGKPATKDKQGAGTKPTEMLSVPTSRRGPEVADVQKVLLALGYKLPTHGVDGIRGSETVAAVRAFQQANELAVDGDPGPETIAALNKVITNKGIKIEKSTAKDVKAKVRTSNTIGSAEVGPIGDHPTIEKAKLSADKFLGRKMDEAEWNELVRATGAEASNNVKECAFVMAVILNRTRKGYGGGNSVNDILHQKNQFQAVTGTRADGYSPSKWFTQGPSKGKLDMIVDGAINILPGAPKDIYRFTAASRAAYGPGTNVGYLDKLKDDGGIQIGGTVFA